jgi:hypothetical protein
LPQAVFLFKIPNFIDFWFLVPNKTFFLFFAYDHAYFLMSESRKNKNGGKGVETPKN